MKKIAPPNVADGDILPLLGRDLTLKIKNAPKTAVAIDGDTLIFNLSTEDAQRITAGFILLYWYRETAKRFIAARLKIWAERMGEKFAALKVKDQSTRWGSCSSLRNLNFNWRLVMLPVEVADYVVIHELAHLKEMNHSAAFWRRVGQFDPLYKEHRHFLMNEGQRYFDVLPEKEKFT